MTTGAWLANSTKQLAQAAIPTARLDCLVLLEDVTEIDRGALLAQPDTKLSSDQTAQLEKLLARRATHEPLAYVRGRTEFYGRDFVVTPAVLEPRPESETMINILGQMLSKTGFLERFLDFSPTENETLRIADVGAGSGVLGLTAALEFTQQLKPLKMVVELLEIDPDAAAVAQMNIDKYTTNLPVVLSDLLAQSAKNYDILLCNLPYVPDSYRINNAALHEPKLAIFGGPDGLDIYRQLFQQVKELKKQPLFILTESLPLEHVDLARIAQKAGYKLAQSDDFIQVFTPAQLDT